MAAGKHETVVERASDRELKVTRRFNGPAHLVFKAWTTPELLMTWWVPKSCGVRFISCDADYRTGGSYRFVMGHPSFDQPMAFFGKFLEVTAPSRLVWTNEEGAADGSVTTVTFEEKDGQTLVILRDLYPSKDALDAAIASGSTSGFDEQFAQLDTFLAG